MSGFSFFTGSSGDLQGGSVNFVTSDDYLGDTGRGHLADGKRQEVQFSLSARLMPEYRSSTLSYQGVLHYVQILNFIDRLYLMRPLPLRTVLGRREEGAFLGNGSTVVTTVST